jgi:hypothetical protein
MFAFLAHEQIFNKISENDKAKDVYNTLSEYRNGTGVWNEKGYQEIAGVIGKNPGVICDKDSSSSYLEDITNGFTTSDFNDAVVTIKYFNDLITACDKDMLDVIVYGDSITSHITPRFDLENGGDLTLKNNFNEPLKLRPDSNINNLIFKQENPVNVGSIIHDNFTLYQKSGEGGENELGKYTCVAFVVSTGKITQVDGKIENNNIIHYISYVRTGIVGKEKGNNSTLWRKFDALELGTKEADGTTTKALNETIDLNEEGKLLEALANPNKEAIGNPEKVTMVPFYPIYIKIPDEQSSQNTQETE